MPRPLPPSSPQPFSLEPSGPLVGRALLLHGFTGTPYEVRPIADALVASGFACTGVVLPGHVSDPAELNRLSWRDWQAGADRALDDVNTDVPRVVVGCSMGGLLALQLAVRMRNSALRYSPLAGIALLAPALSYRVEGDLAAAIAARGLSRIKPFIDKGSPGGDVGAEDAQAANPTYSVLPLRGIAELKLLQAEVRNKLPLVEAPLCTLHGRRDHTIHPRSSSEIAASVNSKRVEHHVLRQSQHILGLDVERDLVCNIVTSFLLDCAKKAKA